MAALVEQAQAHQSIRHYNETLIALGRLRASAPLASRVHAQLSSGQSRAYFLRDEMFDKLCRAAGASSPTRTIGFTTRDAPWCVIRAERPLALRMIYLVHEVLHTMGYGELTAYHDMIRMAELQDMLPVLGPFARACREKMTQAGTNQKARLRALVRQLRTHYSDDTIFFRSAERRLAGESRQASRAEMRAEDWNF